MLKASRHWSVVNGRNVDARLIESGGCDHWPVVGKLELRLMSLFAAWAYRLQDYNPCPPTYETPGDFTADGTGSGQGPCPFRGKLQGERVVIIPE